LLGFDAVEAVDGEGDAEYQRQYHDDQVFCDAEVRLVYQHVTQEVYHVADRVDRAGEFEDCRYVGEGRSLRKRGERPESYLSPKSCKCSTIEARWVDP
jgi:hypothetical protein